MKFLTEHFIKPRFVHANENEMSTLISNKVHLVTSGIGRSMGNRHLFVEGERVVMAPRQLLVIICDIQ